MHNQGFSSTHHFHSCLPLKGFKAYRIEGGIPGAVTSARRDIFQISLVTATNSVCYAEEETESHGHILVFARPNAADSWDSNTAEQRGYNCLFTNDFLIRHPSLMSLLQAPLFGLVDVAVYPLTKAQNNSMALLFEQILLTRDSDYSFKHDYIVNCLHLLSHEALKMKPSQWGYCC